MVDAVNTVPFLHAATDSDPYTVGIGLLVDAYSCVVHNVINGEYEFQCGYPKNGRLYSSIVPDSLIAVEVEPNQATDRQLFRIYKIQQDINGTMAINAHHISYDLSGVYLEAFELEDVKVDEALSAIDDHLLDIGGDETQIQKFRIFASFVSEKKRSFQVDHATSVREYLGMVLEAYGEHEVRFDNWIIEFSSRIGKNLYASAEYGANLTKFDIEKDIMESGTHVYPYFIEEDQVTDIQSGSKLVATGLQLATRKIIPLDLSDENFEDPEYSGITDTDEKLKTAATKYIRRKALNEVQTKITANIALSDVTEIQKIFGSMIHLGDTIIVKHKLLDIDVEMRCTAYKYNVLIRRFEDITIGEPKLSLVDAFVAIEKQSNF